MVDRPEFVMASDPQSVAAERFRRLVTTLRLLGEGKAQVIVVTSALPSEGKTTVATNLALAFANRQDEKTLLVDGDTRRPSVAGFLRPEPRYGLSEIVSGRMDLEHAVVTLKNSALRVLPAGQTLADPISVLSSGKATDLIRKIRGEYQRVVIDTPPIVLCSDAETLGAMSDGILLVARSGSTPVSAYREALGSIRSAPVLGVVLNGSAASIADGSKYYHRYYHAYYSEKPKE
jgi:capsular exopolysaccharide synthesis family protein